jgi:hypothetical protein
MAWKRRSSGGIQQLAEERKTLAERYTIDAEQAQRREQLAEAQARLAAEAAEAARRAAAAEEEERRAAETEVGRRAAEAERARKAAEEVESAPDSVLPALVLVPDPFERSAASPDESRDSEDGSGHDEPAGSSELPIYRWFGRS